MTYNMYIIHTYVNNYSVCELKVPRSLNLGYHMKFCFFKLLPTQYMVILNSLDIHVFYLKSETTLASYNITTRNTK